MSRLAIRRTTMAILLATAGAAAAESTAPAAAPAAAPAPVELPVWMSPDLIQATVQIGMTDAQKPEFSKAVGGYVSAHFSMLPNEVKRNAPDLERRIKSKDKALLHKLDAQVHEILTKEQLPAYDNYKKVLQKGLASAPLPAGSSEPRSGPATR